MVVPRLYLVSEGSAHAVWGDTTQGRWARAWVREREYEWV